MDFRPMNVLERQNLIAALRGNFEKNSSILMDTHDTSFAGVAEEETTDEVINCIRSVPCHY